MTVRGGEEMREEKERTISGERKGRKDKRGMARGIIGKTLLLILLRYQERKKRENGKR